MRGTDLTAVIAWLEAGCDPAEAVKELRSHQDALTSQSLSLSEAREEIESRKVALSVAVQEAEAWRAEAERESANRAAAEREIERLKGLVAGIRETPARTSLIRQETAAVFRGGGRRFFTRKAAERAEAKAAIRKRCECCDGDWETPPEICTYHRDPERLQRIIHLLVVMFIRKEVRP